MENATLGRTGLRVSRLGVGLAQIGRYSADEPGQAKRILNSALDAGVTFLDTAECYGNSEELIGNAVSHRRGEYVLATKAGHVPPGLSGEPWTGKTVGDGIDNSLKRLKTDGVDIVQIHAYDVSAPISDEVLKAVTDARDAGKTRFLGYSGENEDAVWALKSGLFDTLQTRFLGYSGENEDAVWALKSGLFDTLQTSFNLVDQSARHLLFELAEANGVGIIAKRPIANAVWGKAVSGEGPDIVSGTTRERLRRAKAVLDMGPIAEAPDDPIAMALGFVLGHDDVAIAIVGTRNPAHMIENIEVAETRLPIPESVVAELQRRFDELGRDWPGID
jgi:aryl-alcohol dehydrogenase-like predicted oxidoreductase